MIGVDQSTRSLPRTRMLTWLAPLCFVALIGLYFTARYAGTWAEADSSTFAGVVRPFAEQGRLVPQRALIYPNGYTFQAISTVLLATTGIDVGALQQLLYPLLAALAVLPAWLFYHETSGSRRGAAIATVLLFTQPEFLFVVLRSSHEKFTRALMLLCLFLLVRSFAVRDRPATFAKMVCLFYLATFALIASNNLLANSFIAALFVALCLGLVLELRLRAAQRNTATLRRLLYVTGTSMVLVYLITFFIYSPAQHDLLVLKDTWQKVQALFLQTQSNQADPQTYTQAYDYVSIGWLNIETYFLVSIANWIMLAVSFTLWAWQGLRWLIRGRPPVSAAARLLWLLYAAFALQGVLSVVADASGALGSNLQHRLFPSVSIIGVGLIGTALSQWSPRRHATPLRYALATVVCVLAVLSVMKATNEPLLSNKWTFYHRQELQAMQWADQHLDNADVWTEIDERLSTAFATVVGRSANHNLFHADTVGLTRHFLVSDLTELRSQRIGIPLPQPYDAERVYDNGEVQLYHLRPETLYQR